MAETTEPKTAESTTSHVIWRYVAPAALLATGGVISAIFGSPWVGQLVARWAGL